MLKDGTQCWCGSNYMRAYNVSDECTTPCSGSPGTICGGDQANSIYKVSRGKLYIIVP